MTDIHLLGTHFLNGLNNEESAGLERNGGEKSEAGWGLQGRLK
jgi:hypothetical protein